MRLQLPADQRGNRGLLWLAAADVFRQPQANLGHFDVPIVKDVRFTGSDDLCDATKPTEGRAVQDAVSISFEFFSLIPLGNAMAAFSPSFRRWGRHPCLPLRPEDLQVLANHDVTRSSAMRSAVCTSFSGT
jgi:hypothetical protein